MHMDLIYYIFPIYLKMDYLFLPLINNIFLIYLRLLQKEKIIEVQLIILIYNHILIFIKIIILKLFIMEKLYGTINYLIFYHMKQLIWLPMLQIILVCIFYNILENL